MSNWWHARSRVQKVLLVVGAIVFLGAIAQNDSQGTSPTTTTPTIALASPTTQAVKSTTQATPTTSPTTTAATTTTAIGPEAAFGEGIFLVGEEIEPGVYETGEIGSFGCYWERLSGLSGTFEELIANNNADTHEIVEIAASDEAFSSSSCGAWYALLPIDPILTDIPPGKWAIGVHVLPGRYRTTQAEGCYWERLSGFSGSFGHILANDNVDGQALVEIRPSDVGFNSTRCGIWYPID